MFILYHKDIESFDFLNNLMIYPNTELHLNDRNNGSVHHITSNQVYTVHLNKGTGLLNTLQENQLL